MPEHRLQHSMIFPFPCIHAVSPFGPSMLFLQGLSLKKLPNPPTLAEWDSRTYRERPTYLQRDVAATADGIYSLGAVHACGSHPKGPRQSFLLHVPVYLTSTPTCRYTPKNAYLANSAPAPTQYRNVLRNELCELRGGTGASPGLGVPVRSGCHPSAVTTHANDPRCISNNAAPRNAILLGAARPKEKSGRFPSGPDPSAHNPTLRRAPSATSSLPGPRRGSLRDRPGPRDRRTDGRTDRSSSLPPSRLAAGPARRDVTRGLSTHHALPAGVTCAPRPGLRLQLPPAEREREPEPAAAAAAAWRAPRRRTRCCTSSPGGECGGGGGLGAGVRPPLRGCRPLGEARRRGTLWWWWWFPAGMCPAAASGEGRAGGFGVAWPPLGSPPLPAGDGERGCGRRAQPALSTVSSQTPRALGDGRAAFSLRSVRN